MLVEITAIQSIINTDKIVKIVKDGLVIYFYFEDGSKTSYEADNAEERNEVWQSICDDLMGVFDVTL